MNTVTSTHSDRQKWIAVLSKADWNDLYPLWEQVPEKPDCVTLRNPEAGLVMVRGRVGGSGQPFNVGEASVTRCSVESTAGFIGHAYVMGRNKEHAHVAACVDAGLQDERTRDKLFESILEPLILKRKAQIEQHRRKTAATKVDFFTLVRGEDD